MPRIPEYTAETRQLRPDEKGYAAFETAGRRVGPLYNQAAQNAARVGALTAQGIEDTGKVALLIAGMNDAAQTRSGGGGGGLSGSLGRQKSGSDGPQVASAARKLAGLASMLSSDPNRGMHTDTSGPDVVRYKDPYFPDDPQRSPNGSVNGGMSGPWYDPYAASMPPIAKGTIFPATADERADLRPDFVRGGSQDGDSWYEPFIPSFVSNYFNSPNTSDGASSDDYTGPN